MKRLICLIICVFMMVSVFAGCQKAEGGEDGTAAIKAFSVGYGKGDISPKHSVYLCGYGDPVEERMSTTVTEPLYVTTVAFTDEDNNTIIFIATDLLLAYESFVKPLRERVADATGVPIDNIMFHCSHNHSGPSANHDMQYREQMTQACVQSAVDAMADRKPAQMFTTFTRPKEKINTVRHYLLTDGTYMGEGVGAVPKDQLVGHTGAPDNLMQLVKFTREGGKDIILMNWQGHPRGTDPNPRTAATCNYPGIMRNTVEAGLDCLSVFVLGGSGNMNNNSQIPGEVLYENFYELGEGLGKIAIAEAANFKPANTGKLQITKSYVNKDGKEDTDGADLYAFSMGDLAFACAPFEIFSTNAVAVKETSKFPMTFYASCSNESHSYLPTPESWPWEQHYEVRITNYPQGTAESVEAILISMLDKIFTASGNVEVEKEPGYITPEFVPVSDGVEYINLDPGNTSATHEVNNGFWQLALMPTGTTQVKIMLADSKETAEKVLATTTTKLLFDARNVIVDVAP